MLEQISANVWNEIARCNNYSISYGEDAITSNLLVQIAGAAPGNFFFKDERPRESTTGCDFELWIGSDTRGWYRYAMQAKKIHVNSERYPALKHNVGIRQVPQIDILEKYAQQNSAVPLYCFYNYVDRQVTEWNCSLKQDDPQLGCTVTPASVVRGALSGWARQNFRYIHNEPQTRPLRCLWHCPSALPQSPQDAIRHDPLFGSAIWHQRIPTAIRQYGDDRRNGFQRLVESGLFGFEDNRLLPRYLAVLDVSSLHGEFSRG